MKDKTIKNTHFNYANDLVKILGFCNLADFTTEMSYDILKINQNNICLKFNEKIDEFKKLFTQEGFDLRKINYTFVNINQIIAFIKKLFSYLNITWDYSKKKGISIMRLIPPNNLYNNYIMNIRNIPENNNSNILKNNDEDCEIINKNNLKMTEFIDKFKRKTNIITKKYVIGDKFYLSEIKMDWIEKIRIITNDNNKALLQHGSISLFNSNEEIVLYKINNVETKIDNDYKINIPNNFLYSDDKTVYLKIFLSEKNSKINLKDNLTFEIELELEGYDILNKELLYKNINFDNDIIELDYENYLKYFNYGIYKKKLYNNIEDHIPKNYNTPLYTQSYTLSMMYYVNYLKNPFEKKYIISNLLNLKKITVYNYFHWIKIRNIDKSKLKNGITIQLLDKNVLLEYKINEETIFDNDNYFKFEINFLNMINHDHKYELKISQDYTNKQIYLDIIINGSNFRSSVPKMFNRKIIKIDHDPKWYIQGEKEYHYIKGRLILIDTNSFFFLNTFIEQFCLFQEQNIVETFEIETNDNKKETLFYINEDYKNFKYKIHPTKFLNNCKFKNYLKKNNILKTNLCSIGINGTEQINVIFDLCEIGEKSSLKLFYEINKNGADMLKHININSKNFFNTENNKYKINVWIENDFKKIYDFGVIDMQNSLKLISPNNKLINLLKQSEYILVIEIPNEKILDWININMSYGYIYSDAEIINLLSQSNDFISLTIL